MWGANAAEIARELARLGAARIAAGPGIEIDARALVPAGGLGLIDDDELYGLDELDDDEVDDLF